MGFFLQLFSMTPIFKFFSVVLEWFLKTPILDNRKFSFLESFSTAQKLCVWEKQEQPLTKIADEQPSRTGSITTDLS